MANKYNFINKILLIKEYHNNKKPAIKIANKFKLSLATIYYKMKKYKINRRDCKGKNNPNYGNPFNMKGKNHPRYKNGRFLRKNYCIECNKEIHPNAKRCQHCKQLGKLNNKYIDGRSNFPYPLAFSEVLKKQIKLRDKYTCQLCGMSDKNHKRKWIAGLHIHHIDYDRNNCKKSNLITLCNLCNNKINKNKRYWKKYFKKGVK